MGGGEGKFGMKAGESCGGVCMCERICVHFSQKGQQLLVGEGAGRVLGGDDEVVGVQSFM